MVALGLVPGAERRYLGDDAAVPYLGCPHDRGLKQRFLRVIGVEHGGTVLGSDIRSLPIRLPGVVKGEEDVEDDVCRNHLGVERDRNRFRVTGATGADGLITRKSRVATRVTGDHVRDAVENAVNRVETPETTTCENECVHVFRLLSSRFGMPAAITGNR